MAILDPFDGRFAKGGEDFIAGSRVEDARIANRRLVFQTIFQSGPLSRVEISARVGLKPQTISSITRELLDEGLIAEAGRSSGLRGQPQIYLEARADAGYAVGVHVDRDDCRLVVLDLRRGVRAVRVSRFDSRDPAATLTFLAGEIGGLLADAAVPPDRVWGIGLVLPTFGSSAYDFDFSMSHWEAWRDVAFADDLERLTGFAVLVENDATAAAIGERITRGDADEANFVYLYVGHGTGAGVIIDGHPFKGAGGNAGEVGLLPIAGLGGSQCWPDRPTPAGQAPGGTLSVDGFTEACGSPGSMPSDDVVQRLLDLRDHRLMEWIAAAATVVRDVAAVIEVILDPGFIAVGGALPRSVVERLVDRAYPLRPSPAARRDRSLPRLTPAKLIEDAAVMGAGMLPIFVNISHNFRHLYLRTLLVQDRRTAD